MFRQGQPLGKSKIDKVVFVHLDNTGYGGIQRFARDLDRTGAEINLICYSLSLRSGSPRRYGQRLLFCLRLIRLIASSRCFVIFTHVKLAPLGLVARVLGSQYAVVFHGRESWRPFRFPVHLATLKAAQLWAVSQYTRNQVSTYNAKLAVANICIVPLIVGDGALDSPDPSYGSQRVVSIARLTRKESYKGVDHLISAWPLVVHVIPNAKLSIIGGGDALPDLLDKSKPLLHGTIEFLGQLSDEQVKQVCCESALFCLPGRIEHDADGFPLGEGLGIVFLEAASQGLAVLAGQGGGSPESLINGVTGRIVDGNDEIDIAKNIIALLEDENLARQYGHAGRQLMKETRSPKALRDFVAGQIDKLL